jgi:hypothetical protein
VSLYRLLLNGHHLLGLSVFNHLRFWPHFLPSVRCCDVRLTFLLVLSGSWSLRKFCQFGFLLLLWFYNSSNRRQTEKLKLK